MSMNVSTSNAALQAELNALGIPPGTGSLDPRLVAQVLQLIGALLSAAIRNEAAAMAPPMPMPLPLAQNAAPPLPLPATDDAPVRPDVAADPATASAPVDPQTDDDRHAAWMNVLGRHEAVFGQHGITEEKMKAIVADPTQPQDLRDTLRAAMQDPVFMDTLDRARTGKADGKYSAKDINVLQGNKANRAYGEKKAKSYQTSYIPSDATDPNTKARPMTRNDAQRELFRYSDSLPGKISKKDLQAIADGSAAGEKMPPQFQAAAQYYVDHPDEWTEDTGKKPDEPVRKDGMLNRFSKSIELTADENRTLDTLDKNRDVFFPKGEGLLTTDKLKAIAGDSKKSPEVRDAANKLLSKKGSLLAVLLDNGKHGHGGNVWDAANDHKIGSGDLDAFLASRNRTVAPAEQTVAAGALAGTGTDMSAARDMAFGEQDQPDLKDTKGGGLKNFVHGFLTVFSKIEGIFADVFSGLAKIPGIGLIFAGASVGAKQLSGALNMGAAATGDGDIKKAGLDWAKGSGENLAGLVAPGGGAVVGGTTMTTREIVNTGARDFARRGTSEARTQAKGYVVDQATGYAESALTGPVDPAEPQSVYLNP